MYKIIIDYEPSQADNDIVSEGLFASYENIVGKKDKPFSIFLKNDSGKIFGGIQAFFDKESVYIDQLWVDETLRKQGYGKKLLDQAEGEGVKHGCISSITDTWDFQAEKFYLKNGYERMGEIKNYWFNHSRIFLKKHLKRITL
jgi:ribosomal protein S18 acetylase RimI-like enzyme